MNEKMVNSSRILAEHGVFVYLIRHNSLPAFVLK